MKFQRCSGILLHPTSLPGRFGIGTIGKEACNFVDFLVASNQKLWQMLPLGHTGYGDSPYQCFSAFAGNPLLIDLEKLVTDDNLLKKEDLETGEHFDEDKVDYGKVYNHKPVILHKAFDNFNNNKAMQTKFDAFSKKNDSWLDDYALYMTLKNELKKSWNEWEDDLKFRKKEALTKYKAKYKSEIKYQKFLQFIFFKQWKELKDYANKNAVRIVGDIPIFVAYDSADTWVNPKMFFLDKYLNPSKMAGSPPDAFSDTGQLWGNPLYNWKFLKEDNFKWWIERLRATAETVDIIRIDHFIGFSAYWAIPAGSKDASPGKWEKGPGHALFNAVKKELGDLSIIVEDLGAVITPEMEKLRDDFELPGMKVLQFAFDPDGESTHIPHTFKSANCTVYPGTHDNDTVKGWFEKLDAKTKLYVCDYLNTSGREIYWDLIRAAWASTAVISVAPLQDVLGVGSEGRMNTPAVAAGNWQWRFKSKDLTPAVKDRLKKLTKIYRR